jgi:DNA polymerase-3 subunit alpha
MASRGFSHLHVHTEYSILDGIIRIEELVDWTKKHGLDYVAITDHGNLHGTIHFYQAARDAGLKPIIGLEAYVAPTHRTDKNLPKDESNNHLILFAADSTGYRNLVKLATIAYTEGFYYKPRVDMEILRECSDGLIATTACLKGKVNQLILKGNFEDARKTLGELIDIFSRDRLFLEYMYHGIPQQKQLRSHLENLSDEFGIPIIATNDAHYVKKSDAPFQDVLMCVQMNKKVYDQDRIRFFSDEFYLKTYDEMLRVVEGNTQWLRNCDSLANLVNFKMELGEFHFPAFTTPDGSSPDDYLARQAHSGLKKKFPDQDVPHEYINRLNYELELIRNLGFTTYFLIIDDFVDYALSQGISKGPGRGSGAGSLVSYALGITDIDPIEYKLLFERFINPARKSMPDMDLDFDPIRREEVIDYVRNKYGDDYVCNIVTFNRLKARAAVRDVARVLDIPLANADKVSKMIPFGKRIKEGIEINKELSEMYKNESKVAQWLDTAMAIEGLVRNVGVHPAGVIIADKPIVQYAPLMITEKGGGKICQFPMNDVDTIGLIKMDFLGLRTLSYLEDCINIIKKTRNIEIKPHEIPLDDKNTYKLMWNTDTLGVFQLESFGMRSLMSDIRPDRISDVIALIALYRPGPLKNAPHFAARKHKRESIAYAHPNMKAILDETYGVLTYQEQITMILVELAGIELTDAVNIIKIISKKRSEDMINKYRDDFIKGTSRMGIDVMTANEIFDSIVEFAGYGFNKSHSAAYGLLAYWTAYLKANFPLEMYCAFLTSEMHDSDKIAEILGELRQKKIQVLPPDVSKSRAGFSVEGDALRFGLVAIKGVGPQAVHSIQNARKKDGDFSDIVDFTSRIDLQAVNRGTIENLIKSGAMDSMPGSRAQKIDILDKVIEIGKLTQDDKSRGQEHLFEFSQMSSDGKSVTFSDVAEFSKEQMLRMEKQLIGFYITGHPLEPFWKLMQRKISHRISELSHLNDGDKVTVGGLISSLDFRISKKLEEYAVFRLEDFTGSIEVMVFPRNLQGDTKSQIAAESVLMMSGNVRIEVKETQTEDVEPVETRQVRLIYDVGKIVSKPADLSQMNDLANSKKENNKPRKDEILELDYSIDAPVGKIDRAELDIGLPLTADKLTDIGEKLKQALDANPGETYLDVVFSIGKSKLRVNLGLENGCDYLKVKSAMSRDLIGAKWSP